MQGFLIVAPIILLMLVGAILRRIGFFTENDAICMAKLVYWLVSPAVLFRGALHLEMDWGSQANYAAAIYISAIAAIVLVYLFGRYVLRNAGGPVLPVSVLSSFRCNSMMVGIPVVMLAFGEAGAAPIAAYFAITEAGYNLLSVLGAEIARGAGGKYREMLRKALHGVAVNPLFWASVSGLALSALGVHALPKTVDTMFTMVTNMSAGVAILMIGASLKVASIRSNFVALLPDCAVRLLIHPAILYACFLVFPAPPLAMQTAIVITAAPAPNIAYVLAQGMGLDADYAAGLIGITTILFVLSMPFWLNVLHIV